MENISINKISLMNSKQHLQLPNDNKNNLQFQFKPAMQNNKRVSLKRKFDQV